MGRGLDSAKLSIRAATEADVPILVAMIRELAEYERALPGAVSVTESHLRYALFREPPAAEAIVACLDEVGVSLIVGYALFFHNFSSWRGRRGIFLEDLFVRPEMRRLGVGRALLREIARIALDRKCLGIEWLVADWDEPAIAFCRSFGAAPVEDWTTFRIRGAALEKLGK